MIKSAKLALFLVLVILFSGCTGTDTESEVVANTKGVSFDIYADTLQPQIYEGQTFGFQVMAKNEGSYSVPTGHFNLYLEGINPLSYSLTPADFVKPNAAELTSVGVYNEEVSVRGQEVFSFDNLCYKNDLESSLDLDLHLRSCYGYETNAKVSACFGEAYSQFNEICTVTESKTVTNTLAPIQVTEILESAAGEDNYRFIVKVKNTGSGEVFSQYASLESTHSDLSASIADSTAQCRNLNPSDSDIIYIENIRVDGLELLGTEAVSIETKRTNDEVSALNMSKGNYFNLVNNEGQFIFKLNQVTDVDYVGTLEIVLGYGYIENSVRSTELVALPDVVPDCQ